MLIPLEQGVWRLSVSARERDGADLSVWPGPAWGEIRCDRQAAWRVQQASAQASVPTEGPPSWLRCEHGRISRLFRGSVTSGGGATAPESHRPAMSSPGGTNIVPTPHVSRGDASLALTRVSSTETSNGASRTPPPLPGRVPSTFHVGSHGRMRSRLLAPVCRAGPIQRRAWPIEAAQPRPPEGAMGWPAPPSAAAGRGSRTRGVQTCGSILSIEVCTLCLYVMGERYPRPGISTALRIPGMKVLRPFKAPRGKLGRSTPRPIL